MQFTCESCKTVLQIADEKVRGKRLVVRCKRCGAKIGISDPLLAAGPGKTASFAAGPAPARPAAPAKSPAAAPPAAKPAAGAALPAADIESTRAMDSQLLEQAVQASRRDDAASRAAPQAEAEWFAMIGGQQTGPMGLADLSARVSDGSVGPRTYLWRDGMEGWSRAKDVAEVASIFGPAPAAPRPAPAASRPAPAPQASGFRELSTSDFSSDELGLAGARAKAAASSGSDASGLELDLPSGGAPRGGGAELTRGGATPRKPSPAPAPARPRTDGAARPRPRPPPSPLFASQSERAPRTQLWIALGVIVLVGGGALYPTILARLSPQPQAGDTAKPAEPAKPPPPPTSGLTADQVRQKIDENKAAWQGCVDDALRKEPNLKAGKVHIATTIAPSGAVTAARIDKPAVEASPLGACLQKVTRKIAFPAFKGDPFDVDIPVQVTPGD